MSLEEFIGAFAGTCTTLCYVPQVIRALKTRSLKDLSLGMCLLLYRFSSVVLLGFLIKNKSIRIIVANGLTLSLVAVVFWIKMSIEYNTIFSKSKDKF